MDREGEKAVRNSRLDRILYIQQILVQGGVLNKQQTADHFGVSEKTIQRDLDTLRNHFADSEPRREILYNSAKGGYLLDDTLSRFLTSSEILAVCKILLESRSYGQGGNVPHSGQADPGLHTAGSVESGQRPHQQ